MGTRKKPVMHPLTDNAQKIPFDLKDKRHVIFAGLFDLKTQLARELEALKAEAELSYDRSDPECFVKTVHAVHVVQPATWGQSTAASIRVKIKTSSELRRQRVRAYITKIEHRAGTKWKQFNPIDPIPLVWANNNSVEIDFDGAAVRHANVFHIDHNDNKLTIWRFDMSQTLKDFLDAKGIYRVTVAVLGRKVRLDIDWPNDWRTMAVKQVGRG
jgi:hypothetical protein